MKLPRPTLALSVTLACGFVLGLAASELGKSMNAADMALNQNYRAALASLSDPRTQALLRDGQRAWVQFRDAEVGLHSQIYQTSKGGVFVNLELTEARAKQLGSIAKRTSANGYDSGPE